jgi:2-keto-4-pentenoate hydratase
VDTISIDGAADALWHLWSTGEKVDYLPPEQTPTDLALAWRIQRELESRAGGRVGWKVAATSQRAQQHLGLAEPLAGALYANVLIDPGCVLPPTLLAIIEAEFAFRMRGGLEIGLAPFSRQAVLTRVASVHAGLEVPDARLTRYPFLTPPEMVADFMLTRYYCVGARIEVDPGALSDVPVVVDRNGEHEDRRTGAQVLGDPVNALVWLANWLASRGETITEDDVITTGACALANDVLPGDTITARFGDSDPLSLSFAGT